MPWDYFRRAPRSSVQRPPPPPPPASYRQGTNAPGSRTTPDQSGSYTRSRPNTQSSRQIPSYGAPLNARPAPPRPTPIQQTYPRQYPPAPSRRPSSCTLGGCLFSLLLLGALAAIVAAYLLWPGRTNILLLGIDYADPWNWTSRTDTIMMTTWIPAEKYIGILSAPRDLWVNIPGVGENRINTAHFFCEVNQPGSGPGCTIQTIQENFDVNFHYYVRVRFEGFKDVVNTLGGVDITLHEAMAGYEPGEYHLTGNKALAFVRARYDSDDFHRMAHGQFMLKAVVKTMLKPKNWLKIPAMIQAVLRNVDTNLPRWLWPRYAFALLRVGPDNIDNHVIKDDMVVPFTTYEGASVLAPNWDLINPIVQAMFYGE